MGEHKHELILETNLTDYYCECGKEFKGELVNACVNEVEAVADVVEAAKNVMYSLRQRAFDWPLINELETALGRLEDR